MRVYLDNCCYNRPFDEQAQLRVRLETEAKMEVQSQMRLGILEYVWSEMLTGEVCDSPYINLREKILPWRLGAIKYVEITEEIIVTGWLIDGPNRDILYSRRESQRNIL